MTDTKEVTTITGVKVINPEEITAAKFAAVANDMKAAFNTVSIAVQVMAKEIERFYYGWTRPLPKKNVWSRSRSHPGV